MKNLKRFLTLLLTVCIVLALFAGCTPKDQVVWESYDDVSYTTVQGEKEEGETADGKTESGNKTASKDNKTSKDVKIMTERPKSGRFDNLNYKGKTIKYLIGYNPQAWEQQIYDEFEKITGAKIKYIQEGTSSNKLAALIAANDAPDVYRMRQEQYPDYITKKLVQPLNKYIDREKDTWLAYELMDRIKYNDLYYGITDHYWGDLIFVYFNKDLFDKNLDVQKNPLELYNEGNWTWDTFYDLAKKMTVKDDQGHITQYGSTSTLLNLFALSAGAGIVEGSNGVFRNTLNTKQIKDAAEMEKKLAAGGYYKPEEGNFTQGNVAMFLYPQYRMREKGSWGRTSFKWDVAPFPAYTGGTSYTPAQYEFGVVPMKAKNPEAGYMLINYRAYCQENMTTQKEISKEWLALWKKAATGKTMPCLDLGVCGDIWGLYRQLADPSSNTQTVIDSWMPRIDGKIKSFEAEAAAYK